MPQSRLAKKFATNKTAETKGILYEEVDSQGPLFQVRLARINGANSAYSRKINELMKPYRKMKTEDIPEAKREAIYLKAFCECCVMPGTWQTFVTSEECPEGKYVDGIENPADGSLLPATAQNYYLVLEQLPELKDRLLTESMNFDNYRVEALEIEAKN
jgi:hypothetical protein